MPSTGRFWRPCRIPATACPGSAKPTTTATAAKEDGKGETRAYTYDLAGNRLRMDVTNTLGDSTAVTNVTYGYDALNQLVCLTNDAAVTAYAYDRNGNRTSKTAGGTTTTYEFDTANRLTNALSGETRVFVATYDYRTRRLTKAEGGTTNWFRYDSGDRFQECTNVS